MDAADGQVRVITPGGNRLSPAEWYERLELTYNPALVIFDETGKEILRLDSETRRYRLEGTLQMVLEKGYEQEAQLQSWRRDKIVKSLEQNAE